MTDAYDLILSLGLGLVAFGLVNSALVGGGVMSERPDDIPNDVWLAAIEVAARATKGWTGSGPESTAHMLSEIARAILAERERCAEIAQRLLRYADTTSAADIEIAAAIRGRAL